MAAGETPERRVFGVAEANRGLAQRVAERFRSAWIRGDLVEVRHNPSWPLVYLTLRDVDEDATMPLTMRRLAFEAIEQRPTAGTRVVVLGRPTVWSRNATLSLEVKAIERDGAGMLLARLEEVKRRLDADGLLDVARKRRLPVVPRAIGVVTGREGDAWHDLQTQVHARYPGAWLVVCECPVTGPAAAPSIVAGLQRVAAHPSVDVLVLTRGGGSLEDLLPFSDEAVCRAVAACRVPVVSAVGHERDTPLCDLVADVRAATPSHAARLVVPDAAEQRRNLERLGELARAGLRRRVSHGRERVRLLAARPALARPSHWVETRRSGLATTAASLRALAPGATLARGYAIVLDADGHPVRTSAAIAPGDAVRLRLAEGGAAARIEEVEAP